MPYKYCTQCKTRIKFSDTSLFCGDECKLVYEMSPILTCLNCEAELGKASVTKIKYCNNKCHNEHQATMNVVERICIQCNNIFKVQRRSHKYKLCSVICEKKYAASDIRNDARMKTLKINNRKKYNVDSVLELASVREKASLTKKIKYGSETYNNVEKRKSTKLEKYGNPYYSNSEKAIQSKLERYGSLNVNDKAKITKLKKYGTLDFSSKARKTTLERYGTTNFSESAINTRRTRHGSLSAAAKKSGFKRLSKKYKHIVDFMFCESEYEGVNKYKKYEFSCVKCSNKFVDDMCNGNTPTCPVCFPVSSGQSISEVEILDAIKKLYTGEVVEKDRKILNGQEIDIYIPDKNLAIEFDGLYWHGEHRGEKNKTYHITKTNMCKEKNIRLIHIFENEWLNKKEIVLSRIKAAMGIYDGKSIYARKCVTKEITYSEKSSFLESFHIQGNDTSKIFIGSYYMDKLVAVMTFGKNRIALGNHSLDGEFEMHRFCTSTRVIGIAGKMLSFFIKHYNPTNIITYADRRYCNITPFYEKLNFKHIKTTSPGYWYFNRSTKLHHRFSFRKNVLHKKLPIFDENLTEWDNMKNNGYDRIWDCGHMKYEWSPNK